MIVAAVGDASDVWGRGRGQVCAGVKLVITVFGTGTVVPGVWGEGGRGRGGCGCCGGEGLEYGGGAGLCE